MSVAVTTNHETSKRASSFTVQQHHEAPLSLTAFKPPDVNPPYPVTANPHYLGQETAEWFHSWLLETEVDKVVTRKMLHILSKMDIPKLCAYVHPSTALGKWGFEWISKYCGFLFVVDDIADASEVGTDPRAILPIILDINLVMMWSFPDDSLLLTNLCLFFDMVYSKQEREEKTNFVVNTILVEARNQHGTAYPREIMKACKCFADVWMDALKQSTSNRMLLIAHYTQHWLMGVLQEATTRKKDQIPSSIEDYIAIRRRTTAVIPFVLVIEIGSALNTPRDWIDSPEMHRALDAANDFVAWDNDIWSFNKEALVDKDITFNVVALLSKYQGVTYQRAGEILREMLQARIEDLDASILDLEKITPPELMDNFYVHAKTLQSVVAGCHAWYKESSRYQDYQAASQSEGD